MKFDQDLCLNLQYDFGKMNSTLGSVVPLAMFIIVIDLKGQPNLQLLSFYYRVNAVNVQGIVVEHLPVVELRIKEIHWHLSGFLSLPRFLVESSRFMWTCKYLPSHQQLKEIKKKDKTC